MNKKFFLISAVMIFAALWSSCTSGQKEPAEAPGNGNGADSARTGKELLEQLKASAVDENDISARLQATVLVLQEEYDRSEAAGMKGVKKVKVAVEGDCVLSIANNAFGREVTRVNLNDLDRQGFSLIPDLNEGDSPGLRIQTSGLKEAVELYKDGKLVLKKPELVILMADRQAIERITPYMLQALNICQGVPIPE